MVTRLNKLVGFISFKYITWGEGRIFHSEILFYLISIA